MARLQNVASGLRRAVSKAEHGLSAVQREDFHGIQGRLREAVLASERLADILVRLSQQGLRPCGAAGEPVTAADVEAAVSAVRSAIGALALPARWWFHRTTARMRKAFGPWLSLLARPPGAASKWRSKEKDEWDLFQQA